MKQMPYPKKKKDSRDFFKKITILEILKKKRVQLAREIVLVY